MEVSNKDSEDDIYKPLNSFDSAKDVNSVLNGEKEDDDDDDDDDDDEAKTLLPKEGVISKKVDKSKRKVQWNDRNGDKLAEVLEFVPSEVSDSDDEESDSCFCRVM